MKQKCKVVALSTKKEVGIGGVYRMIKEYVLDPDYKKGDFVVNINSQVNKSNEYWDAHHLYLVSDEEMKEGDYVFDKRYYSVIVCEWISSDYKKVIATTDEQLNLPIVPERLVKEYCDKGGIDEVMVEIKTDYEAVCEISPSDFRLYNNGRTDCEDCVKAKKVIEVSPVKESWTI